MKVVYSWLREFCPTDLEADDLADRLTGIGVKVEDIERPWDGLQGVVIARVIEVRDHPDSSKLCVVRVQTASGEATVCAGVRNMQPGDIVPYAVPGSRVPGLPEPLAPRRLRGVLSEGMLCSPRELNIADVHTGILVLPEDAPVGEDVKRWLGLDDVVFDIEIEPNRPDLMSVVGVAREASAVAGVPFALPVFTPAQTDEAASARASVEIVDPDRCPRYLARVIRGVSVGESPLRVQARLTASGMRPLSNVVDATNYALLELGHPLHPFDLDRLEGSAIVVRSAQDGERITTLDGVDRALSPEDLLIADRGKGVAVAGVMGSAAAEVSHATRNVLLESAYFERSGVLRTSRRLGLSTEASMRFERGADPEAVPVAADRAAQLMVEWSGGEILSGFAGAGDAPVRRTLIMRPERAGLVLGFPVGPTDAIEALGKIGIEVSERNDTLEATVPGFRVDLEREIDLIEEVVRIEGYERVGSTLPGVRQAGGFPTAYAMRRRVRELLVRSGLREVRSFSFASGADLELTGDTDAIRVSNPLVAEEACLRTRLAPGLLRTLARNRSRGVEAAALFEVGTVFRLAEGRPEERATVGLVMTGPVGQGWHPDDRRDVDLFDVKGAVEALLQGLTIEDWSLGGPLAGVFHPGRSAELLVNGSPAGTLGELHPSVAEGFDLGAHRVALAEIDLSGLTAGRRTVFRDLPRFPPVRRDLAFVLDANVPASDVRSAILEGSPLVGRALLFDVFTGEPVPDGKKSLAFAVDFRSPERTLTDEEADAAVGAIAARLASAFGAELRSG